MSSFARGNATRGSPQARASSGASSMNRNAATSLANDRSTLPRTRASPSRGLFIPSSSRGRPKSSIAQISHQSFRKSGLSNVQNAKGNWQERYTALQESRKRERNDAIKRGLMADPDKPTTLAEAITLVGTCQDMCAEFERVERVVQKDVWKEEVDPTRTGANPLDREPDESRMVKKFRRAAAGIEEQLPSDLRPPPILQTTCDYLFTEVIGAARDLASVHHFVWDRTRAIRNDFSIQQLSRPEDLSIAINCYEQIARFHILSLHQLALPQKPYDKYDWQQEREQLDRTLLSLIQYYDDSRGKIPLPNESEFRAYCVIFQLRNPDPDLEEKVQTWPGNIANHPRVRAALKLYAAACNTSDTFGPLKPTAAHAIAQQDWHQVWRLIESKQLSYLMACVAEIHFNMVRENVLHALLRSGGIKNMVQWSIEELRMMMAFDTEDDLIEFCARYDLAFITREGRLFLDFSQLKNRSLPSAKANAAKQSKTYLVEQKRGGRSFPAVINGLSFKQASERNMIAEEDNSDMEEMTDQVVDEDMAGEQSSDDGLFVSEHDTEPAPSIFQQNASPAASTFKSPFASTTFGQPSAPKFDFATPSTTEAGSASTFGKPSTTALANSSAFGQPSAPALPSTQPTQSPSIFAANSTQQKTDGAPVFDFLAGLKQAQASDKSTESSNPTSSATTFQLGASSMSQAISTAATSNASANPFSFSTAKSEQTAPPTTSSKNIQFTNSPFPSLNPQNVSTTSTTTNAAAVTRVESTKSPPLAFDLFPKPVASSSSENLKSPSLLQDTNTTKPVFTSTPANNIPASSVFQSSSASPSQASTTSGFNFKSSATPTTPSNADTTSRPSTSLFSTSKSITPDTIFQQNKAQPLPQQQNQPKQAAIPPPDLNSIVAKLAQELTCEPKIGFLKQYVDFVVSQIVTEAQETVYDERLNEEARLFRHHVLTLRYGRRWRMIYRHTRLTKQARERRNRAFKRLNDHKSQTSAASSTVGDGSVYGGSQSHAHNPFSSPTSKRDVVDKLFQQTNGVSKWAKIAADQEKAKEARRQSIPSQQRNDAMNSKRLTTRIDTAGRIVKPSPSNSVRSSGGRQSLASQASPPVKSTTKSNYFRLKALGMDKIDTSLALSRKRGYSELSSQASESSLTSSPAQPKLQLQSAETANNDPPESPRSKMLKMYDEEDALFARLRAARANLQEGMSFYQTEVAKSTSPQSASQSKPITYDSPSMQKARQEARWRLDGADVPAYRLRESRFVPRWSGSTSQISHSQAASPNLAHALPAAGHQTLHPDLHSNQVHDLAFTKTVETNHKNGNAQPSYSSYTMQGDHESQATFDNSAKLDGEHTLTSTIASTSFNKSDELPEINSGPAESPTLSPSQSHDFTIKPSQIPESLAASFGPPPIADTQSSAKSALDSFEPVTHQEMSHEASWPFALPHETGSAYGTNGDNAVNSINGDTSKIPQYSDQRQNPFTALQDEDDMSREQSEEVYSAKPDGNGVQQYDDDQVYYNEHQNAKLSEAELDTDVDDEGEERSDEEEEDGEDATSKTAYHDTYGSGYDDEANGSEDYDSEASEDSSAFRHPGVPVNEALLVVGNTEEDAIELSD